MSWTKDVSGVLSHLSIDQNSAYVLYVEICTGPTVMGIIDM